ncbi:hypothetical protein BDV97DRAFT_388461 [Delphinella strobiligena]|nr:hypothetical protein BDV97DRAFT_388461 [Delphinella strobiligena]
MEELPPELAQMICSNLTPKDLKSVRLTSKQLAASGACYILPRVFVANCKKSFDELKEIAQHPTFSKHVTTLIYDHTFLAHFGDDFVCWNKARPNTCYIPRWVDFEPYQKITEGVIGNRSDRAMRRARTLFRQAYDRCPEDPAVIERLWDFHRTLVDEQRSEGLHKVMLETMKLAFSSCPKLDHIILGIDHHMVSKNRTRLFTGLPIFDDDIKPDMVSMLNDVSIARESAGRSVRHLSVPLLSMIGCLRPPLNETFSPDVTTKTMQGIKVFILTVQGPEASRKHADISRRHVSRLLQSASQLEVLKIIFSFTPAWTFIQPPVYEREDMAHIHRLINDAQWPALHTVTFSRCCLMEDVLQVILSRYLISSGGIEFYLPTQGKLTTSVAMKLQTFIIEGGAFPPDSYIEASIGLPINIAQGPFDDEDEEQEEDQED